VIEVAIVGVGHWGPNYVRNFMGLEGAGVRYVCDIDKAAAARLQRAYPSVKIATDYRDVLDDPHVDAVVVATPAGTHYEIVRASLQQGKHVLVEKPLALSLSEGHDLAELAERGARVLMVGYTFLFNPGIRALKAIVEAGDLGDVYYLHAKRTNLGPVRYDVNAMWDLASHDLSICSYLLGRPPARVAAQGGVYLQPGVPDVAFVTMTYSDNVIGHLHVSWLDPKKTRQLTIVGSKKMAVFDDLDDTGPVRVFDKGVMRETYQREYRSFEEFKLIVRGGSVLIPEVPNQEPLRNQCAHFAECIYRGTPPLTGGAFGADMIGLLLAAQASLDAGGVPVDVGRPPHRR
jgi:predicted dehydrogenase